MKETLVLIPAAAVAAPAAAQTADSALAIRAGGQSLLRVNVDGGTILAGQYGGVSIRAQAASIETLEAQNAALTARLERLEQLVAAGARP